MQVNNTNYMFPAKANPTKPVDLFGLVDLNYFIQSASSAKYGIILVDACRNNPLVKYFQNGKHKGSTAKKGLGPVTPTVGQVVIGFATSAGDTADDGSGSMSPYARALSVRLKEPNKDITKVLGLVALDVSGKHNQNPVIRTNLAYDVCLSGGCNMNFSKIETFDEDIYVNMSFESSKYRKYLFEGLNKYCNGANDLTRIKKDIKENVFYLSINDLGNSQNIERCSSLLYEYHWKNIRKNCSRYNEIVSIKKAPDSFNFKNIFHKWAFVKGMNRECYELLGDYALVTGVISPP